MLIGSVLIGNQTQIVSLPDDVKQVAIRAIGKDRILLSPADSSWGILSHYGVQIH